MDELEWQLLEEHNVLETASVGDIELKTGDRVILKPRCKGGDIFDMALSESWTEKFPDPKASSYYVECRYFTTILKKALYILCDGGRYRVPAPEHKNGEWVIDTSSLEYKISEIYRQYHPLPSMLPSVGIKFI